MVIVDTSAWIEYFGNGNPETVNNVDRCLGQNLVGIGDLIYCEVMQGIRKPRQRATVSDLLLFSKLRSYQRDRTGGFW